MDDLTRYFIATSRYLQYLMHSEENETDAPQYAASRSDDSDMSKTKSDKDKSKEEIEHYLDDLKKSFRANLKESKFVLEIVGAALLAIYTGFTIAMYFANKKSADAAKSAADTAKDSLVISQRTYLTAGYPTIELDKKIISFQIINSGHIPSSATQVITYEGTWNPPTQTVGATEPQFNVERHKQINTIPAVVPTTAGPSPISIGVTVPEISKERLMLNGTQLVLIVGTITYDAGFEEVKGQRVPFCIQTVYQTLAKSVYLIPCDPNVYLPRMESADWNGRTPTYP